MRSCGCLRRQYYPGWDDGATLRIALMMVARGMLERANSQYYRFRDVDRTPLNNRVGAQTNEFVFSREVTASVTSAAQEQGINRYSKASAIRNAEWLIN